jgi:hypothetical protein
MAAAQRAELEEVVERVATLKQQCDAAVNEKNRLNALSAQTKNRLGRASKLTSGRWTMNAKGGCSC